MDDGWRINGESTANQYLIHEESKLMMVKNGYCTVGSSNMVNEAAGSKVTNLHGKLVNYWFITVINEQNNDLSRLCSHETLYIWLLVATKASYGLLLGTAPPQQPVATAPPLLSRPWQGSAHRACAHDLSGPPGLSRHARGHHWNVCRCRCS